MTSTEADPFGRGPYPVASTNLEVAAEYVEIGDDAMHDILLGRPAASGRPRFLADILRYPQSAWITEVRVPDEPTLYGLASGASLSVVTYITYPSSARPNPRSYTFPYHGGQNGIFEDMLGPGEGPAFADPDARYPLIIVAHGTDAHGLYDVAHAQDLASHGYIVAVITYGDDRIEPRDELDIHVSYLRPLLTTAVLDSLLESATFGTHIDDANIGITGHSFGGFTALAVAGGLFQGNPSTVSDRRVTAGVIAAPWVGGNHRGENFFAFGPDNNSLNRIEIPILCFFGTDDEITPASFILPAMKQLSGPTYVVEFVDQPHVFESGSWEDRNNWELLFFSAYLKQDPASLATLRTARSMRGGNDDVQLFDYRKPDAKN